MPNGLAHKTRIKIYQLIIRSGMNLVIKLKYVNFLNTSPIDPLQRKK